MRVAVGIVTFNNTQEDLARFGRAYSLSANELNPEHSVSLLYVDNGAQSNLKNLIPSSHELEPQGNIGYTRAMNRLMKHAFDTERVDAFIPANPDGTFHHQALKNFITHHQKNPSALLEARQFPEEHAKVYDPVTLETPWCSGCCLFIPKSLYLAVGAFDENFFMYMEDVDYSWRVRSLGFSTQFCPDVLYFHGVITRKESETTVCQYYISGRYLAWKWGHKRFFRWAQKTLLNKKGYTLEQLPSLPSQRTWKLSRKQRAVTCFNHVFSFSEKRW